MLQMCIRDSPYTGEEEEILIENTETRDQPKNRENAMRQLRSILYDKEPVSYTHLDVYKRQDPSNDGTYTAGSDGVPTGNYKFWKSLGSWNGGTPQYPKLWWEE